MNIVKEYTELVEDILDKVGQPLRPYFPILARFFLVVTFLEDSLRIVVHWNEQVFYLQNMRGFPWGIGHVFLVVNVVVMISCSALAIAKRHTIPAVIGLSAVVFMQSLGYGLLLNLNFFLRNLSLIGALLMLVSDAMIKRKSVFPGLPVVSDVDRSTYFQLAGRILLILLFLSLAFSGEMSALRLLFSAIGLVACIMVVVGFKARWSAMFLVVLLSVFNIAVNNWWSVEEHDPYRDFIKYDFFQVLSIMGGLLILVSIGPGGLSLDEKKKSF